MPTGLADDIDDPSVTLAFHDRQHGLIIAKKRNTLSRN